MAIETWVRGPIRTATPSYRFKPRNGSWGSWTSYTRKANNVGRSELVTSQRANLNKIVRYIQLPEVRRRKGQVGASRRTQRIVTYLKSHNARPNPFNSVKRTAGEEFTLSPELPLLSDQYVQFKGEVLSALFDLPIVDLTSTGAQEKSVESQLFQKASSGTFDAYTQVGEMMETVSMLKRPLSSLTELASILWHKMRKDTKGLKGGDLQEAITGSWLENQFGIMPLITGTAGLASDLVDALSPHNEKYAKLNAYSTAKKDEVASEQTLVVHPSYVAKVRVRVVTKTDVWVRGGMWLAFASGNNSPMSQLGLSSMRSIVSQAWALLPLSFAVDWFVGVGPLLDECRPVKGRILSSYKTIGRTTTREVFGLDWATYTSMPKFSASSAKASAKATQLTRSVNVQPPGALQLGPLLFSLTQGMSGLALAAAPMKQLWRKLPWH